MKGYFSILEQFTDGESSENYCAYDVSVNVKVSKEIIVSELETCIGITCDSYNFISYTNVNILKTFLYFLYQKLEILMISHPEEAVDTGEEMICILEKTDSDDDCFPEYEIEAIQRMIEKARSEINLKNNEAKEPQTDIFYECDEFAKGIDELITAFSEIKDVAYFQYKPVAEDICSRIVSEEELNHIMDRMMDFCDDIRMLELFRKICRKYLTVYPENNRVSDKSVQRNV